MRRTEAETRLETDTSSETVDKGLFRRRKLLLALEPSENFPAQIYREPLDRRASFAAIGSSSEIYFPLNISKASSSPDNWISSLRNDLPSIAESSDEGTVTMALSSQITTNGKNVSRFKACNGGLAGSQNTSRQPAVKANHSQRSSKSPRSSKISTNASKLRNNIANRKGVTRSKSDNWKIRVHKTIIIDDDDIDDYSSSQSSRSSSSSRPSSWCGDTRFPSIDRPVKKHSY